nr:MAG: hypothetical protein [Reoviridae sp.]
MKRWAMPKHSRKMGQAFLISWNFIGIPCVRCFSPTMTVTFFSSPCSSRSRPCLGTAEPGFLTTQKIRRLSCLPPLQTRSLGSHNSLRRRFSKRAKRLKIEDTRWSRPETYLPPS